LQAEVNTCTFNGDDDDDDDDVVKTHARLRNC